MLELTAHLWQTHSVAHEEDWTEARAYVVSRAKPEDLVAFAPRWADPLGRRYFGAEVATVAREARADESRFPRAFEVSIRGSHLPSLADWKREDVQRFGAVTVTSFRNPAPAKVLDNLASMVDPSRMRASRVDGAREIDCPFTRGGGQSGGLGYGPAVPASHFACPGGGFVAESVVADLDYLPRRCIYAPPMGGILRLRFLSVLFGRSLHGHHGLYVEAERGQSGAPVTIAFKVGDSNLGRVVHRDGDGWKPFELPTEALEGQRAELVAELASTGDRRMICFEADTR